MVRRGSTVRVRQRASRNALQNGYLSCPSGKRLSRAGPRGHYLVFPRQAYRQVVFGLIKLIRTDLTPSVTTQGHRRIGAADGNERKRRRWRRACAAWRGQLWGRTGGPSSALNLSVAFGEPDAHARAVPLFPDHFERGCRLLPDR